MKKVFQFLSLFVVAAFTVVSFGALAEEKKGDVKEEIERHEHIAEMHKKAAECLKSGKSEKECHEAMEAQCKEHCKHKKDGDECPMHKHMHGDKMKKSEGKADIKGKTEPETKSESK